MHSDKKLFRWILLLILLPIVITIFGSERFRYPCQDPNNWEKNICKKPLCDVTRTCPEHIFRGQRDPRLGPSDETINSPVASTLFNSSNTGVNCGK